MSGTTQSATVVELVLAYIILDLRHSYVTMVALLFSVLGRVGKS